MYSRHYFHRGPGRRIISRHYIPKLSPEEIELRRLEAITRIAEEKEAKAALFQEAQTELDAFKKEEDKSLITFRKELLSWLQDDQDDSLNKTRKKVALIKKSCAVLKDLLLISKCSYHHLPKQGDLDIVAEKLRDLEEAMPATNGWRVLGGIISAILTPIVLLVETFILPYSYYKNSAYEHTKWLVDNTYRMFHTPVYPAVKILEEIYQGFQKRLRGNEENHCFLIEIPYCPIY